MSLQSKSEMKYIRLTFLMLRYRVAIMLLMFFYLGVAYHYELTNLTWSLLWAALALSGSYIAATTINDIVDKDIDRINHPDHRGRPLVTGEANEKDLLIIHISASLLALTFGILINFTAFIIIAISLLINYVYSAPPFRVSYRTHFAPILLSGAYVLMPYILGFASVGGKLYISEKLFLVSLLFLFFGRIILKDFRDIKGDKKYGKPTFLLKYGKAKTIFISFISIFIGNILLFVSLPIHSIIIFGILEILFLAIYYSGLLLLEAKRKKAEQTAIGIGAKIGNGLLIIILGILILKESGAENFIILAFTLTLVGIYVYNFFMLIRKPEYAVIGYKG